MSTIAIRHSELAVVSATEAWRLLSDPFSLDDAERAWLSYLTEIDTVFEKLDRAASEGEAARWWEGVRHERRKDPLLRYIHQARNSARHGLVEIATQRPGHFAISGGDIDIDYLHMENGRASGRVYSVNPERPAHAVSRAASLQLVDVVDKYKNVHAVPREHLGAPIHFPSPQAVAALGLRYVTALVARGRDLLL
jgi:hypothetical protein